MTLEEVKKALESAGVRVVQEKRLPNETGTQLRLEKTAVVNIYDNGNVNVQGKDRQAVETVEAMLGLTVDSMVPKTPQEKGRVSRKVFVVYGHDARCRDQLEATLRRWGLEPLILDQLPTEGQTVIEKLESAMVEANFGVVLATPDDEGYRAGHADEKAFRARQNVVLEMGMLLSRLGRKQVAILLKTQENMERPSDIQGLIYIPFKDDIAKEAGVSLAKAMDSCGYKIDVAKL